MPWINNIPQLIVIDCHYRHTGDFSQLGRTGHIFHFKGLFLEIVDHFNFMLNYQSKIIYFHEDTGLSKQFYMHISFQK